MKRLINTVVILFALITNGCNPLLQYNQSESPLSGYEYFIVYENKTIQLFEQKENSITGGAAMKPFGIAGRAKQISTQTEDYSTASIINGLFMKSGFKRADILEKIPEKTVLIVFGEIYAKKTEREVIIQYYDANTKELLYTQQGYGNDTTSNEALNDAITDAVTKTLHIKNKIF